MSASESEIRHANEVALRLLREGNLDRAHGLAMKNVNDAAINGSPALIGNCAFTLGRVIHEREMSSKQPKLAFAINAYEEAVSTARELEKREEIGAIQLTLATALLETTDGDRKRNLQRAIAAHKEALLSYTEELHAQEYARIQYNMGVAYTELSTRFNAADLDDARKALTNASRAFDTLGQRQGVRKAEDVLRQIDIADSALAKTVRFLGGLLLRVVPRVLLSRQT